MPRAELAVTIPDRLWIGELSRQYPDATIEILTAFPKEDGGVALAEITGSAIDEMAIAMREYDEVTAIDFLERTEDTGLVEFETSNPFLLLPIREAGTPLELPFQLVDGTASWEITASRDRLSTLSDQLREFGIQFDVRNVQQEVETQQLLTPKQLALVRQAVEIGYYDTPRDATLTGLAEAAGIAKSTCSETLHRAEEKIIKEFVEDVVDMDIDALSASQ
jgi:hypothetical protein